MELRKTERPEKNTVVLEIAIGAEEFDNACNKAYRKNVKRINVPGFRKGKAPRKVIENYYGAGVFYEDAFNECYPDVFDSAVKEAAIEPVDSADVDILEISKDGVVFTAKVTVKPEVTIKQYKGIEAVKQEAVLEDGEVEQEINEMAQRNARIVSVDRAIKNGDDAVIDFEGFIDGVPFDGGKAEKFTLKIGSGQFIPGFEDQLIGKKAGEDAEISVKFPDDYHAEEFKGKPAVFKCKIHEVKETVLPEIDDEFAKDVSEFDTLEELKADLNKKLLDARRASIENEFEDAVLDKIIEGLEADIPDIMISNQIDSLVNDFANTIKRQGMPIEQYFETYGMSMESLRAFFKDQAERQVKTTLILDKVAQLENLEMTEEELESEYEKMATRFQIDIAKVKEAVKKESIEKEFLAQKAADLIFASAVAVSPKDAKPKAAKKSSAKKTDADAKKDSKEEKKPAKKTSSTGKASSAGKTSSAAKTSSAKKAPAKKDEDAAKTPKKTSSKKAAPKEK